MIERPDILNNQAIQLASDGSYTEAIACFKRAITLDRSNPQLWFNLGVTYRDNGELLKARDSLRTAYSLADHNVDVVETYAVICIMLKDYASAMSLCQEYLFDFPLESKLWNIMGVCAFNTKDYENASEYFEEAVYINPYYEDAIYNLMDTYNTLGNKAGEEACANKLREMGKKI